MFKPNQKKLISVASIVLVILLFASIIPALRQQSSNIFELPFGVLNLISREIKGIFFYHRNMIQSEKLMREVNLLQQELNTMHEIYLENSRLKNLLGTKQQMPYKAVPAAVIGRPADNWSSAILVDKGSSHGIRRGMVVVSYLGLVGRVVETSKYTASIMLINDPSLSVSGVVRRSRQEGLVSGTLGGTLVMRYLPKDADIKLADTIVTSGLTEAYPKGLLIGKVVDLGDEFSGLTRYAIIKPAVSLSGIEEVLIIIP